MKAKLKKNIEYILKEFFPIGSLETKPGVTRLGYSKIEDEIHNRYLEMAQEFGLNTYIDQVGNSYAFIGEHEKYHLLGSHLDSVIEGGRYDGVVGVAVGLAIMKVLKDMDINIPIKTVAFRCEESANFMSAMIGSGLITGSTKFEEIKNLKGRDGISLEDIFEKKNYSTTPNLIDDVIDYIEVHIEQGRVLEEKNNNIGIVDVISGGIKIICEATGLAEHAGATPMNLRKDSLAAVAEIILAVEEIAKEISDSSVGTVGFIENSPNSINVVSGNTKFSIDLRDNNSNTMEKLLETVLNRVDIIAKNRNISINTKITGKSSPANLSKRMILELENIAKEQSYNYQTISSGASHDCIKINEKFDSALIFIPCKDGVSHNPLEEANINDMVISGELVIKYLLNQNY